MRTVEIRNVRVSEVLQELGFHKVGSNIKARGCHSPFCFGCECCGICKNCRRGLSYVAVHHDVLEIPDGISGNVAKSFIHSAMKEFGS